MCFAYFSDVQAGLWICSQRLLWLAACWGWAGALRMVTPGITILQAIFTLAFARAAPAAFTVNHINPDKGSLAGGQLVTIKGTDLTPESPDPLIPATVVTIGGVPCDIVKVLSTSSKLVCKTRPFGACRQHRMHGCDTLSPAVQTDFPSLCLSPLICV